MELSSYRKRPTSRDEVSGRLAHIRSMSTVNKHSASKIRRIRPTGGVDTESGRMGRTPSEPRLSVNPLSAPADILRQMPSQALSPALLQLLDLMSGPILLILDSPAGEERQIAPAMPVAA